MKKSFRGERFFNTGNNKNKKDFETSSMNIFKNTTENDGSDLLLIDPYNNREMSANSLHAKSVDYLKNIIAERITH